ncbi:phage tail sheath family protein [Pyxidicoccus sp. 3LFB2]
MAGHKSPGVFVEEVPSGISPIQGVGTSTAGFIGIYSLPTPPPETSTATATAMATATATATEDTLAADGQVVLCTNFTEFTNRFRGFMSPGSFADEVKHSHLVHAVYGFFQNGGTRCFVTRVKDTAGLGTALAAFETIDEIAIVVAPGATDAAQVGPLLEHCAKMKDRFAVLDSPETGTDLGAPTFRDNNPKLPQSHFAAYYYPWLQVFDPAVATPANKSGLRFVPPSGHVAGIYARVDATRGVHKAPANEPVRGALGLRWAISQAQQEGLNPNGVNCIREVNGSIRVWGARTLAGTENQDFKYVNVRRLFSFLYDSLRAGLQWTVFEPNTPDLWARITRNTTSFLNTVWASGALFGTRPEEAFYVKCDAETNPPEQRELGQVTTEIGIAIVRPAEFVVFKLSQWSGPVK